MEDEGLRGRSSVDCLRLGFYFPFFFSLSFFAVILGVCIHVLYRLAEITKDKYSIFFYVQADLLRA